MQVTAWHPRSRIFSSAHGITSTACSSVPTLIMLIAVAVLVVVIIVFELIYYQLVVYFDNGGEWHDWLWQLSVEDFKCLLTSFVQALLARFFQPSSNTLAASGSSEPLLSNVQARTLPPPYFVCHISFHRLQYIDWYFWRWTALTSNLTVTINRSAYRDRPSYSNYHSSTVSNSRSPYRL